MITVICDRCLRKSEFRRLEQTYLAREACQAIGWSVQYLPTSTPMNPSPRDFCFECADKQNEEAMQS